MRSIDNMLDRFCRKHPRFGIPNLMLIIIIGNAIVFLLDRFGPAGFSLSGLLSFTPYDVIHGQIWRLVTFVFIPLDSNPFLFLLSLYMYWWIGTDVEREWGSAKFTLFYLVGMLMSILSGFVLALFVNGYYFPVPTADANYLNLSLFFTLATLFPDMRILLFFIIPLKAKWLGWANAALFLFSIVKGIVQTIVLGPAYLIKVIPPIIAILNYVLFFWSDILGFCSNLFRRTKHKTSRQTINFQNAAKQAHHQKGYIHKCAVCGKTDTDYPQEEFRYCSKCNGYYCYCSEHINNHVHIE